MTAVTKFMYTLIGTLLLFLFFSMETIAQVRISGMVTDQDTRVGLPGVSIWNKRAKTGTISNDNGTYVVYANPGDTIEFTMISYVKHILIVPGMNGTEHIAMKRQIFGLQEYHVRGRIYKADSLAVRNEYGKFFDYRRPGALDVLKTLPSNPITALTYMVPSKTRKRKEKFGEQLVFWEQENHIDYRFSPDVVYRHTKLESPDLERFMLEHRPSYQFLEHASDYDLLLYIKTEFEKFKKKQADSSKSK
jgi:hypothetical protein